MTTATATPVTFHGLTRDEAIELVWRTTHRDFRSEGTGERRILTCGKQGGTVSVAVRDLTDAKLLDHVAYGIRWERRKEFTKAGLIVNPRHHVWAGAVDHEGRAYVVNQFTGERRLIAEAQTEGTPEERMSAAFMVSEDAADAIRS